MLVWHVDSTDVDVWEKNMVNCNPERTYMNVQRADPQRSKTTGEIIDSDYDTYPGKGNITTAQLIDHNGNPAPVEFLNIAEDRYTNVVSFVIINTQLPKLEENFESLTANGTNVYTGAFTDWTLSNASVADSEEDGARIQTVRGATVTTGDIERRIYSVSFDFINPATSATVKCEYSTNRGITWKSLQELSGTDSYVIPAGERHIVCFIVPGIENARYRITQSAGHRTNGCFIDNVALQREKDANDPSSVDAISISSQQPLAAAALDGTIAVKGEPRKPVSVYAIDGTLLQQALTDGEGQCTIATPYKGIVIVAQGSNRAKLLCR